MKKVIYIFIIGLGLIATSCQKQDIAPNDDRFMEMPEWSNESDENARVGDEASEDDKGDDFDEDDNQNGIEITDPNKPSEGSGGRGGKGKN